MPANTKILITVDYSYVDLDTGLLQHVTWTQDLTVLAGNGSFTSGPVTFRGPGEYTIFARFENWGAEDEITGDICGI